MELRIRKWGNSAAVLLPAGFLEQLQAKLGDTLSVVLDNHKAVIELAKPKYSLKELLAQCDSSAPMPNDLQDWQNIQPIGNELL